MFHASELNILIGQKRTLDSLTFVVSICPRKLSFTRKGMGRTWEKSELFSNFFVNISTFKVRPCFASPGKIPQIPQNEQKDQRRRIVWVGHDKFLKIG